MKALVALIIGALFLALPMASAWQYSSWHPAPSWQPHHGVYHDHGVDVVFRGEVTRIQRLGGTNPRVEVTMRVRDRIQGNPPTTVVLTFHRYRDAWGHWHDNVPLVQGREYVIGARRVDNRYRLVWFESPSHYRPPAYWPSPWQVQQPPITIPNPHTTGVCSVVEVSGQIVVVCPSQPAQPRFEPLAIGTPQPTVHLIDSQPRVPIARYSWLH